MPLVSEDFVKNAQALAEGVPALQAKLAEAEKNAAAQKPADAEKVAAEKVAAEKAAAEKTAKEKLAPLVEATVNTLVEQGLIPATEKSAAATSLMSHEEALQALVKTAQLVRAEPMGVQEKVASTGYSNGTRGDDMKDSDRMLLSRLGFSF